MGNLLRRVITWYKLQNGRCEQCGTILPDIRPFTNYRACSDECADAIWVAQTA